MSSLADLLRQDLGEDFPVDHGNAKRDDPLVITEIRDYVAIEYMVARHVLTMLREEFALSEQKLHDRGGEVIDELVFDVKEPGEAEWSGRRRFFFDITHGFRKGAA